MNGEQFTLPGAAALDLPRGVLIWEAWKAGRKKGTHWGEAMKKDSFAWPGLWAYSPQITPTIKYCVNERKEASPDVSTDEGDLSTGEGWKGPHSAPLPD